MKLPAHFDLCWMQIYGGGTELLRGRIPVAEAWAELEETLRDGLGAGAVAFLRDSDDVVGLVATALAKLEAERPDTPAALLALIRLEASAIGDTAVLRQAMIEQAALYLYEAQRLGEELG